MVGKGKGQGDGTGASNLTSIAGEQRSAAKARRQIKVEPPTDNQINEILDRLEQSVTRGQTNEVEKVTGQMWELRKRLPEVLTERLIVGRTKIPAAAFEMLFGFAGLKARTHLKAIADSPRAADIVRFGAHRRMGWSERGEAKARLTFLNSLKDAESTMVEAVRQGTLYWPPDGEILAEVVGYLEAAPMEFGLRLLPLASSQVEPAALAWLLRPLLHSRYPAIQKSALSQLAKADGQASLGAIRRLAQTASDPEIRSEAEAVLRRSQFHVVARHSGARHSSPELPQFKAVWASPIDGDGGQVVLLQREWMPVLHLVAGVMHKDSWGIKDAFGFYRTPAEESAEMVDHFGQEGVELVEIDIALARGILNAGIEANAATGHRIPPKFEIWEPLFHDAYPAQPDEQAEAPDMDDSRYRLRNDLLRKSHQLLDHPFFDAWIFEPKEIAPLLIKVAIPRSTRGISDAQLVPLVRLLVDKHVQHKLRRRLGRQAKLFDRLGDAKERDLCLAAAASLSDETKNELGKHPFLRQMVLNSISNLFADEFYY